MSGPPERRDFLAWGQLLEAGRPESPRIGEARTPADEIVRFGQDPFLHGRADAPRLVPATDNHTRLMVRFMGLFGPNGPLPLHLTEYAERERASGGRSPFADFADVLQERFIQLFYRAWAEANPVANAVRPDDDRFAARVRALGGLAVKGRKAGPDRDFATAYAGFAAGRRSRAAIESVLRNALGAGVRIEEFRPVRLNFEADDRTALKTHASRLGRDAVLGASGLSPADGVRVHFMVADMAAPERLLPGGRGRPAGDDHARAMNLIRFSLPAHLDWDVVLSLPEPIQTSGAALGGPGLLGLTAWLKPLGREGRRSTITLRPDPAAADNLFRD